MNRLRDVVPAKRPMDGEKVPIDSVLNVQLEFTAWSIRPSKKEKDSEYLILQFMRGGRPFVVMTGGEFLIRDVKAYEQRKGREPFEATIVKRGRAYVFE